METYLKVMLDLSATMMRGIALSLDLPRIIFDGYSADAMATVRLLHYPPQPAQAIQRKKAPARIPTSAD